MIINCYYCVKDILLNSNPDKKYKNQYIGKKPYCLIHGYIGNRHFVYDFILYEKIHEVIFKNNIHNNNIDLFNHNNIFWYLKPNIYHNGISYIN